MFVACARSNTALTKCEGKKWPQKHSQRLEQAGLKSHEHAWTTSHRSKGVVLARDLSAVNVAWVIEEALHGGSEESRLDLMIDLSQCPSRTNWSRKNVRSLTTSSCLFSYRLGRTLRAAEHFSLIGIPVSQQTLSQWPPRILRDLSGEAFSGPCASLCMMAALLSLPRS